MSIHHCNNIHSGLKIYAFNMQMIQMARETNCHQMNTTTTTSTSTNQQHNFSSNLFTGKSSTSMGLLSISLDNNCKRDTSVVISPSCQPVSCLDQSHLQQQQQQLQKQQQQQQHLNTPQQQQQLHHHHRHQGQFKKQFDDQSNILKPTMAFSSTSKSSCSKQELNGTTNTTTTIIPAITTTITSSSSSVPSTAATTTTMTTNPNDDQLMASSAIGDVIIKSSANSGYCSSFGSSSTSFFDDEETASHNCDNNQDMSGDDDNNIDADGLVDHVVADAGEEIIDDDTVDVVDTGRSTSALAIDEISTNLLNTSISNNVETSSHPSNYVNSTIGDDDSHAYPINIQCGSNELTLMVEENLTAAYLINILLLKFSLEEDVSWTLFMKLTVELDTSSTSSSIDLQCMIEDFEEVVPLFLKYQSFATDFKLILRKANEKLTMYHNLSDYFDLNMIDLGEYGRIRSSSISFTTTSNHSGRSNSFDGSNSTIRKPSTVSIVSSSEFQQLQRFLLISETFDLVVNSPVKVVKCISPFTIESHNAVLQKTQLILSHVNSTSKDVIDFRSNRYDLFTPLNSSTGENLFYLACPTEKCPLYKIICSNQSTNNCWLSCLRLAKIGMQNMRRYIKIYKSSLHANPIHLRHGSFGSKGNVSIVPSSPPSSFIPSSSSSSLSSSSYIATTSCRQNITNGNPSLVSPSKSSSSTSHPSHEPWFYENLTREQASKLLSQYSSINGVFLVRQSNRAPGTYVLSLVLNRKILHIIVMSMQTDSHTYYLTLDQGKTKFADLSQLIQFYQLNHSLLGCKLTHYVAKNHH